MVRYNTFMDKVCRKCNQAKPLSEFWHDKRATDTLRSWCKDCEREQKRPYMREYRKRRKAAGKHHRGKHRKYKPLAIEAYGGKCVLCGFTDIRALTIHHVYNDGALHRNHRKSGEVLYRQLHREGYPQHRGLVIFCANCHMIEHAKTRAQSL